MQFSILQENLHRLLQDLQKCIPVRPQLPILSCVLIKADEKGVITFSATDLQFGMKAKTQGTVIQAGSAAVPAKVFIELISSLNPGKLDLVLEDLTLKISASDAKAKLQCFEALDYPTFPEKEGQSVSFGMAELAPAIQATSFATSADDARPVLTTLLFSFGASLEIVGTDGFRLAKINIPFQDKSFEIEQLLLPSKAVNEAIRVALRQKVETVVFAVSEKLRQVFFCFDNYEVMMRIMDGDFPPYQKIVPSDYGTQILFDGLEFQQKMKTATIFARESSGIVKLTISKGTLTITSSSSSLGTQESTLPIQIITGGDQEIAFNSRYLQDFLAAMKPEKIWLGMNESLKPAALRPENLSAYSYIIMPFRVNT